MSDPVAIVSVDEEILNLVGTWEGNADYHHKVVGFVDDHVGGITMIIEDQKGRTIHGYK